MTLFVVLSSNFNFADVPVIGSASTEEQNKKMYERYGDKSKTCPDCKRLCSPQAQRCMGCRVLVRLNGTEKKTIFITNDEDFKTRARKRIKELAEEEGWSSRAIEQHLGL